MGRFTFMTEMKQKFAWFNLLIASHEIRVIGKSISLYPKDYLFSIMNQATVLKKAQVKNSFAGYLQEKDGHN